MSVASAASRRRVFLLRNNLFSSQTDSEVVRPGSPRRQQLKRKEISPWLSCERLQWLLRYRFVIAVLVQES
jgi:hypothetical protein